MEDPGEPRGLARFNTERDDVHDLEVDRVSDADAVAESVLDDLDAERARLRAPLR